MKRTGTTTARIESVPKKKSLVTRRGTTRLGIDGNQSTQKRLDSDSDLRAFDRRDDRRGDHVGIGV